ncbi:MAG: NDP-sugar pyrophosphorylase family protein [Sulfurimonas sp.]|jgi:NDP-sugar pyrophosphorylase family protein|uniref:hypothetical protein n=1 Tax=Sulfurimonas sp. TaxID=2022749 RepID=UPI0039E4F0AF
MKLCIIVNNEMNFLNLHTMSIAGKEIVEYWLEWARYKGYETLDIYLSNKDEETQLTEYFENLYGVKLVYRHIDEQGSIDKNCHTYRGIGIFLDNNEYKKFKSLDDVLVFEQILIQNPLKYSSLAGYGKSEQIHIGKDVYIHESVKLFGNVFIGDNCRIEQDVVIEDSIIDKGCNVKGGSIVINSHITQNIYMNTQLYLKDKALFESHIYDVVQKRNLVHSGLCIKN